ncbi:MAG TPA: hypothetical protein VMT86_05555 [Bryobacteraceae bacterium]|nr:hypothetical protein [Bryobacteraceae bacterium]
MSNKRCCGNAVKRIAGLLGLVALAIAAPAFASPITVDVAATDVPWLYSDTLNSAYQMACTMAPARFL